ncbi:hypothetical protein [Cohnella soli]|uniref:Glycosyl hydrolase family 32 N-terminal domain-containing protein n=1 Tax=Cohnella soli TaxID=425005 RepID=A0ABW0HSN2_9BACL
MSEQGKSFFGNGFFEWQFAGKDHYKKMYEETPFNKEKYWGGFPEETDDSADGELPGWAVGPFEKYEGNPIFAPDEEGWDCGRFSGGVHNGAVVRKDGKFYYIYRGEFPLPDDYWSGTNVQSTEFGEIDYICDIGIAVSEDGVRFTRLKEISPLFRHGEDAKYSYEDVCVVRHEDSYYLFCNQWDWKNFTDPKKNGVFISVSKDLLHWEKRGLAFPNAATIHRNPCVLQNPHNEAVRAGGKFVMYLNDGIVAYSDDLLHWESKKLDAYWPGGEGCFALAEYSAADPDAVVLFTGGHHTGHFYAVGEVLLRKDNPEKALGWLPKPILHAEEKYPWEDCRSADDPDRIISSFRDTIFFTGLTKHDGKWWLYYGGSEYYTCLATAEARD